MPIWEQAFEVRASELDLHGRLAVPALCNWLQEAAGRHAHSLHWAVHDLAPRGLTWVLSRLHLQVASRPAWAETVHVATWPSGVQRLYALREFRLLAAGEESIAVATSAWLLLDLARRRPVRPGDEIDAIARSSPGRALEDPFSKLPSAAGAELVGLSTARFSDLDINNHVNNVALVRWLLDGMPDRTQRERFPCELEVEFRAEVAWGDVVEARVRKDDRDGGTSLHALVRRGDGQEVVRARTVWRPV